MKKIILITLIFIFQSLPTLSNEIEGKGLYCSQKDNVGIMRAFFFYKNSYEEWGREVTKNGKVLSQIWFKSSETYYERFPNVLYLYSKLFSKEDFSLTLDRYTLTLTHNLNLKLAHPKAKPIKYSCEVSKDRKLFLNKLKLENSKYIERRKDKLNKRKF